VQTRRAMFRRVSAIGLIVGLVALTAPWARASTIVVTSLADPGSIFTCSLRQAITNANKRGSTRLSVCVPGTRVNTIIFAPGLTGTIALRQTLPTITGSLTISGPSGSRGVTIDGAGDFPLDGLMRLTHGANLTVQNLTFSHGVAFGGGAINNFEGTLTVSNCTFNDNQSVAFYAGAISNEHGSLLVTDSTFSANSALDSGAAIANFGNTTIEGCTFTGNRAYIGSAVLNFTGSTAIVNSTFAGNLSSAGGAVLQLEGSTQIVNSTFANNPAGDHDRGALIISGGVALVKGSIFTSTSGPNCGGKPVTDDGYNISSDSSCHFTGTGSLSDTDPELDPAGLADNGGPTDTIALTDSSPANELIPVDSCTDQNGAPLTVDQRGYGRPAASHPDFCSAGAFEFDAEP
jgi:hypothetical protein